VTKKQLIWFSVPVLHSIAAIFLQANVLNQHRLNLSTRPCGASESGALLRRDNPQCTPNGEVAQGHIPLGGFVHFAMEGAGKNIMLSGSGTSRCA
jgi:hypothetical protein